MRTKKITLSLILIAMTIIWLIVLLSGCKEKEPMPIASFSYCIWQSSYYSVDDACYCYGTSNKMCSKKLHNTIQWTNESHDYNHIVIDYGDGSDVITDAVAGHNHQYPTFIYGVAIPDTRTYTMTITIWSESKKLIDSFSRDIVATPHPWYN